MQQHNEAELLLEEAKNLAAVICVQANVESGQIIGIGSGSTVVYAVNQLGSLYKNGSIKDIICVPSSFQAMQLIINNKLPLGDLQQCPCLDICIDGADEVDENLNCIKGGGGCLTQEKIVMSCAKKFFIIADFRKQSRSLGEQWPFVPIEVLPSAFQPIMQRIQNTYGGECNLRMALKKAGPVVTDNGNFIIDWKFPSVVNGNLSLKQLNEKIIMIPGVVETGFFIDVVTKAYFGMKDGSVREAIPKHAH
ncbi:Probable-ribose 5-phosphate isomerase [Trichinella nelsoni]|uniref:ribose-5-phosphate isomerase n=1 Tax=Trichinella nelsoni TaxID=6336 RepID=A0A0V0SIY7_9BILA|nr:Probable-ribose 5-phosphate isomerase [Trichinella nelsoni]